LLLFLQVALLCISESAGHEALVIIGGIYPDGSEVTEVEVWSPSPECGINFKDPPITFEDLQFGSAVAFLDGNLFVCGGQGAVYPPIQYNITLMNRCYVYSMADNEWSEGPNLKFFLTSQPSINIQLWLATVGDTVVAVFRQDEYWGCYMSTLIDNEWSEPVPLDNFLGGRIFSMVALDENHFALLTISLPDFPQRQFIEIINVKTASRVTEVWNYGECLNGFLYNDQYSCSMFIHIHEDGSYTHESEVWSLTFQEDFSDPAWSVAYDLPDEIWNDLSVWYNRMAVVDGMLTAAWPDAAIINYLDGDQWKTAALDIPRENSAVVVVPCN